jgi:peroxiredoxin
MKHILGDLDPLAIGPKPGKKTKTAFAIPRSGGVFAYHKACRYLGATMTIQSGDPIPNATFTVMAPDGPQLRTTDQIFKGRKVVLFGVAGAFTPVCDKHHLPGFLDNLDQFKAQGVDEIAVTGVNDVFVMDAWAKSAGADGKITFLADGNGDFARAVGLSLDLNARGLGIRSQRYAMIVDNGVVRKINVEAAPGKVETSSAETLLTQL